MAGQARAGKEAKSSAILYLGKVPDSSLSLKKADKEDFEELEEPEIQRGKKDGSGNGEHSQ